jgi:hypothetical protein
MANGLFLPASFDAVSIRVVAQGVPRLTWSGASLREDVSVDFVSSPCQGWLILPKFVYPIRRLYFRQQCSQNRGTHLHDVHAADYS